MKKTVIKAIAIIAIAGMVGCKKKYECVSYNSQYMVCAKGGDTVRYVSSGYTEQMQRILAYYQGLGYQCTEKENYFGVGQEYKGYLTENDMNYLESQGFSCKKIE